MCVILLLTFLVLPLAAQQAEYEVPDDADRIEIYRTGDNHKLRLWIYEPERRTAFAAWALSSPLSAGSAPRAAQAPASKEIPGAAIV